MTQDPAQSTAPDLDLLERLAREAVDGLPDGYRSAAAAVLLRVADLPPDEILDEMEIDDPYDLTGLYEGVPLTEKSVMDQPMQPDTIWLFRRPILDEWVERGDVTLRELVTHVMIHELAHHFGWSDEDIASIDPWWE
ncbi:metallopeptidase family protein [Rhodobacter sp. NSM]|uniref:metallopeptidase family protein n=1 Tax=Rhodobacter sp. NSM TaxID=3457501 RepID=UPI003FD13232